MDTEQQQAPNIGALASQLMAEFSEAQRSRAMVNERWLEDLRQYRGIYAGDVSKRLKKNKSSRAFYRLTTAKVNTMTARLMDLLFPQRTKNWSISPTPGQAIVSAQPSLLLAWADATRAARSVENFAYDRLTNPNIYYVYPAVCEDADVWVEATYSAAPEAITSPEQEIGLPEGYAAALKHHILASILSGDNESSNASKASLHLQLYAQILGIKLQVDAGWPKAKSTAPAGGAA